VPESRIFGICTRVGSAAPPGTRSRLKIALRRESLVTGSGQACAPKVFSTQLVSRARCSTGYMSFVYEVVVGAGRNPPSTIACSTRSYSVMTLCWCGANFGGATITHAPTTAGVELSARSLMVAVTGPSETSSYQSSLAQK